jgi:A/G-specific adenine glycosylase
LTGVTCSPGSLLKTIKHGVTRYRITLECFEARYTSGRILSTAAAPVRWVALDDLAEYPLSTTGRKIASLI